MGVGIDQAWGDVKTGSVDDVSTLGGTQVLPDFDHLAADHQQVCLLEDPIGPAGPDGGVGDEDCRRCVGSFSGAVGAHRHGDVTIDRSLEVGRVDLAATTRRAIAGSGGSGPTTATLSTSTGAPATSRSTATATGYRSICTGGICGLIRGFWCLCFFFHIASASRNEGVLRISGARHVTANLAIGADCAAEAGIALFSEGSSREGDPHFISLVVEARGTECLFLVLDGDLGRLGRAGQGETQFQLSFISGHGDLPLASDVGGRSGLVLVTSSIDPHLGATLAALEGLTVPHRQHRGLADGDAAESIFDPDQASRLGGHRCQGYICR